ncbi:hypothetical protein M426DRAFT_22369 [Hypoxylon sp. CI-4A]|nr:hypothetical protein M426DRAFT_22369 [Hypoxylon sp. CI-4A]
MSLHFAVISLVWCLTATPALSQTFSGFEPATSNPLIVAWEDTPLNYSGQLLSVDFLNGKGLPTVGLPTTAECNGTYILLVVDPDAIQGDIETQAGLHTIQGNFTCDSGNISTISNTTFLPLSSESEPLAPYIEPEPQAQEQVVTHRYTLLLFNQPDNYSVPNTLSYALALDPSDVTNRLNFNIPEFSESVGDSIVAGTYFDVDSPKAESTSTSTATPSTPTASASSTPDSGASGSGNLSGAMAIVIIAQCIIAVAYMGCVFS